MEFFDSIESQLYDLFHSRLMPIYWLVASVFVSAFTQDVWWIWIGVIGFAFFMLKGYFLD